jgi:hypothetical protein
MQPVVKKVFIALVLSAYACAPAFSQQASRAAAAAGTTARCGGGT